MFELIHKILFGEKIWYALFVVFILTVLAKILTNKIAGPVKSGRVVNRSDWPEHVYFILFVAALLWCSGRQIVSFM